MRKLTGVTLNPEFPNLAILFWSILAVFHVAEMILYTESLS